ncbi:SRPBCC domain-containing protein [Taibaiella lutea]|uniref:SRPBCC domain-containing protein n=1 Tax=Taibaiella lutea TaxID=2608001 RepID=A0A5M6CR22_9BACT|nr:SRPBCC family protein [Taibaiella lutea]KAA5536402.1 SRPBCC domain-containing protein [Taibaiella lutea]
MSSDNLIANAQIQINATVDTVWDAFVNPAIIKQYMFGTTVTSDWEKGSSITWKGEMDGKTYEDKGEILEIIPQQKLKYTHFSPSEGTADSKENYHTVTVTLHPDKDQTEVKLSQDKNATEKARESSEKNWNMMLESLKKLLEKG